MPKSQILLVDPLSGKPVPIAPDSSLILSSANTDGEGITVEQQRLPPTEMPPVYLPQHTISLQLKPPTVLDWQVNGRIQSRRMIPGDICFLAADAPVGYRWQEEMEVFNVALDPDFVARATNEFINTCRIELVSQQGGLDPQIQHIGMALKAELEAGAPSGRLFCESLATALAIRLLQRYNAFPQSIRAFTCGLPKSKLRQVTEYIHDNLNQDLPLVELAQMTGLSASRFKCLFKQSTGLSPHQYVIQQRVEQAKRLLGTTALTIREVALEAGFADQSHLARLFRRIMGRTPKEYRDSV